MIAASKNICQKVSPTSKSRPSIWIHHSSSGCWTHNSTKLVISSQLIHRTNGGLDWTWSASKCSKRPISRVLKRQSSMTRALTCRTSFGGMAAAKKCHGRKNLMRLQQDGSRTLLTTKPPLGRKTRSTRLPRNRSLQRRTRKTLINGSSASTCCSPRRSPKRN